MFDGRWRSSFEQGLKPVGANIRRTGITADHLTATGVVVGGRSPMRGTCTATPVRFIASISYRRHACGSALSI